MDFKTVGVLAAALVAVPGVVAGQTDDAAHRPPLSVRTVDMYGLSSADIRVAQEYANAILWDAGIEASWTDCGHKTENFLASPTCGRPLASNEVIVRIVAHGPSEATWKMSMGFSLVSSRASAPCFSTVFADVVESFAREAGGDFRRVLGYAFAHELAHLLMNDSHHAAAGLMREVWTRSELRRGRRADWTFLSKEAETMRNALAAREVVGP